MRHIIVLTGLIITMLATSNEVATASDKRYPISADVQRMLIAEAVGKQFNVDRSLVEDIVEAHSEVSNGTFSVAEVLAVIAIESSFRTHVKSQLKTDKAVGLTQVRPGVWNIPLAELETVHGQVKHGILILEKYHKRLGNKTATLHAYNIGITAYRNGDRNPNYVAKYNRALSKINQQVSRYVS